MKTIPILALSIFLCACASLETRIAKTGTSELKLRHAQIESFLVGEKKQFDLKIGSPMAIAMMGDDRPDRIEEKEAIERELLRRWKSGDAEAHLPIFGAAR